MVVQQGANTILTRWYSANRIIKDSANGVARTYTFIGGDPYTAPCVAIKEGSATRFYYLLRDYLGSITHVVDTTNTVLHEYSYDAWGRMRDTATWMNYAPGQEPDLMIAGRGFTGHEHLPWFKLINMNGRVYDPLTGQFQSPDNYVQAPDFTQSYNRYSYCLNNPLSGTDPSGERILPGDWSWRHGNHNVCYLHTDGGGGFSEGDGGHFIWNIIDVLFHSPYGGEWSRTGGVYFYRSDREALEAGIDYVDYFNDWQYTESGSRGGARFMFKLIETAKTDPYAAVKAQLHYYAGVGLLYPYDEGITAPFTLLDYVNANFGNRLPRNVSITWLTWGKSNGLTKTENILNQNANITVYIPIAFLNDPITGLLYDCIDHEIVHINDYAHGRALAWYYTYGWVATEAIMDYRAYSRNQRNNL